MQLKRIKNIKGVHIFGITASVEGKSSQIKVVNLGIINKFFFASFTCCISSTCPPKNQAEVSY